MFLLVITSLEIKDEKEPKFNLSTTGSEFNDYQVNSKSYNKKIIDIAEDELSLHKKFLKSELKKNFY